MPNRFTPIQPALAGRADTLTVETTDPATPAPATTGTAGNAKVAPGIQPRRLSAFSGTGYDKGRSVLWQAAWIAVLNLAFMKWWMPVRFRPAILRAFGADIGDRVRISQGVRVLWPWKLSIGADCWIREGVWLLNLEKITIEHDACLSQEAFLCTGSHRHADPAFGFDNAPIRIGAGAWVAARATVLRGTTVRPGVLVGSGSVVRPIPAQGTR
jgi:putative colanic acid biosynthesis acetyltransferase WcaF